MTSEFAAHFASDYQQARDKFLVTARARGWTVERHLLPGMSGVAGETLSMDLAIAGAAHAPNLLFFTSGTHGVEGFCGSGAQVALLSDDAFMRELGAANARVVLLHALNPYGFSHLRRTNEDNIDLNRNFRDYAMPSVPNSSYADVHAMMVPSVWPPDDANVAQIGAYIARHGATALQAAVTGGQGEFPDGLFYAGVEPAWSNTTLRSVLREHGAQRRRIAWIDFHTGLGPWGHGEKIYNGRDIASDIARTRACWGADVTSFLDGTSTSAPLTGLNCNAVYDACPQAEYAGIALEYGVLPFAETLQALRADQWLQNTPQTSRDVHVAIKRQIRDAFYGDRDDWKQMIVHQALTASRQALGHLAR